jgi:hypothetical protein
MKFIGPHFYLAKKPSKCPVGIGGFTALCFLSKGFYTRKTSDAMGGTGHGATPKMDRLHCKVQPNKTNPLPF